MQIIGPDGTPIESLDQLPPGFGGFAPPAAAETVNVPAAISQGSPADAPVATMPEHTPVPIQTRAPATTIDALEREFQRKKQRELDQARAVGTATATNGNAPRVTGEKVGRNDPCPCGSGKKFKKCHGTEA
jgi:preprotein translocase subunit SecA